MVRVCLGVVKCSRVVASVWSGQDMWRSYVFPDINFGYCRVSENIHLYTSGNAPLPFCALVTAISFFDSNIEIRKFLVDELTLAKINLIEDWRRIINDQYHPIPMIFNSFEFS